PGSRWSPAPRSSVLRQTEGAEQARRDEQYRRDQQVGRQCRQVDRDAPLDIWTQDDPPSGDEYDLDPNQGPQRPPLAVAKPEPSERCHQEPKDEKECADQVERQPIQQGQRGALVKKLSRACAEQREVGLR